MMLVAEAAIGLCLAGSPALLSRGVSGTAEYIAQAAEKNRDSLLNSFVLGQSFQRSVCELEVVATECSKTDWDGYSAFPVATVTHEIALQFLKALPSFYQPSSIGAEPDGHITMEWYQSQRRLLSLSISPEGMLYYAALVGTSRQYGSELFMGNIPSQITNLINKIAAV